MKASTLPKFYWNLTKAKKALETGDTPFTPAISLVLAARAAMLLLQKEGREGFMAGWLRHHGYEEKLYGC